MIRRVIMMASIGMMLASCVQKGHSNDPPKELNSRYYKIVVVDGCEYITVGSPGYSDFAITHKGNCSNPIHQSHIDGTDQKRTNY